jgi:hypothetical protein
VSEFLELRLEVSVGFFGLLLLNLEFVEKFDE